MGTNAASLHPRMEVGKKLIVAHVDESEVIFTQLRVHSLVLVLLMIHCRFSRLPALWTETWLQALASRDGIFPHTDTTELRREAEMLKIRGAALSTILVSNRLDRLWLYGFGDYTGLLGATSGSTSVERPLHRCAGPTEQGAAAEVAAEELRIDSG
jgi:hypothetical protein